LTPAQALAYVERVLAAEPRITVAGIAGPGDPFANPEETMQTLRLVREKFPDLILCLATNGLGLPPYVPELADLQVSHVSITVNAVDPEIGRRLYGWVRDGKVVYRGLKAAELLLSRQLEAIAALKAAGLTVKVNTIVVPGINDGHVEEVARQMAAMQVDILNVMPMYPNVDTPFADIPEPAPALMSALRGEAEKFLPQMHHCTRCRADAVGLLAEDRSQELHGCLSACAVLPPPPDPKRPYVAVATREGALVNLHLGEAPSLQIWGPDHNGGFTLIEERAAPLPGSPDRWWALAHSLNDCRAVLVSAVGETPRAILKESGVLPLEVSGFIDMALQAVYDGSAVEMFKTRQGGLGKACTGNKGFAGGCF
jgi:nitrogen fixation protein NifB